MPKILEELLRSLPDLGSSDNSKEEEGLEAKAPLEIKLMEIIAIQAVYPQLNKLILNIYGALIYAGKDGNAENLLALMIEFLPEDKATLLMMKKKAAFLFQFYDSKHFEAEKAYNFLTLLNAITAKYESEAQLQKDLHKLQQKLVEAGKDKDALKALQKEKASLEKLDLTCRQLKRVLEEKGDNIDAEIEMALEPQKLEIKKIEAQLNQLIQNEKAQLISKMVALQKQVLNQAEYKLKTSIFFNQKRLDQSNAMSALLAEASSKMELFEYRQLFFVELINEINLLYKETTAATAASSQQAAKSSAQLNAAFFAAAAPILLTVSKNLVKLKEVACKLEKDLAVFKENLDEIEKALRMNKVKRALRNLEQGAEKNEVAASPASAAFSP